LVGKYRPRQHQKQQPQDLLVRQPEDWRCLPLVLLLAALLALCLVVWVQSLALSQAQALRPWLDWLLIQSSVLSTACLARSTHCQLTHWLTS
jgi:hypothetical protein